MHALWLDQNPEWRTGILNIEQLHWHKKKEEIVNRGHYVLPATGSALTSIGPKSWVQIRVIQSKFHLNQKDQSNRGIVYSEESWPKIYKKGKQQIWVNDAVQNILPIVRCSDYWRLNAACLKPKAFVECINDEVSMPSITPPYCYFMLT